ncbi:MAG: S26 family signal peptidase [bacterium]
MTRVDSEPVFCYDFLIRLCEENLEKEAPLMKAQTTKKHVTPKWVDRLLIGILLLIPILYAAGFNVNYGPSMSYLGWVYRTSWGEQPTRIGQIVRFAQPGQPTWRKYLLPSIKRVAEIRKDGYFVEGDNTERSQDSRDWCKDVQRNHVAGVVVWCWSPARAWRSRTSEGKLRNWLEMNYAPCNWKISGDRLVLTFSSSSFGLFSTNGRTIGYYCTDELGGVGKGEAIFTPLSRGGRKYTLDLETGRCRPVKYELKLTPFGNGPSSIGFEGDVTDKLKVGMKLELRKTVVSITSIDVLRGGPAGASTVVRFKPKLDFFPTPSIQWRIIG